MTQSEKGVEIVARLPAIKKIKISGYTIMDLDAKIIRLGIK